MITFKKVSECTFAETVQIWNEGFAGYYVNLTMNTSSFLNKLSVEGLSPELSFVAYIDGEPAGFLLNGVRMIDGKKVAWNGGTGVAERFRGQGVGKALMEHALEIYRQEQVEIATLEAFVQNDRAIGLYKKVGYEIVDILAVYAHEGQCEVDPFRWLVKGEYLSERSQPQAVKSLPFYQSMGPWQTTADTARGESLIVYSPEGDAVGYALYHRILDETGTPVRVTLQQLGWDPFYTNVSDLIRFILAEVFHFELPIQRGTHVFPRTYQKVLRMLEGAGFACKSELVQMMKVMNSEGIGEEMVDAESISGI
jgi:ribosomal protein S18 acetylase RimI-like enzyme